jgi:UDP-N-acetylglucosamine transferase subunit ALG13
MVAGVVEYARDNPDTPVYFQSGINKVPTQLENLTAFAFAPQSRLDELISQSEFVVTHAGTGSIIAAIESGKKVVVLPRLQKYAEHNDDHQVEIARLFYEAGHVLYWEDGMSLAVMIEHAKTFTPVPYQSTFQQMLGSIHNDLDEFLK